MKGLMITTFSSEIQDKDNFFGARWPCLVKLIYDDLEKNTTLYGEILDSRRQST